MTLPGQPMPNWLEWAGAGGGQPVQLSQQVESPLGAFRAFVGLGANVGDAHAALESALRDMHNFGAMRVERVSSAYVSAPVDAQGPDYLNAVAQLSCLLGPLELLHALQAIEVRHGRQRPFRHAPRTLDLDLLWYGGCQRRGLELILPHPRWDQRAFVLEPLAELLAEQLALDVGLPDAVEPAQGGQAASMPQIPSAALRAELAALQKIERSPRALSFK